MKKSKTVALLLWLTLGWIIGAHRIYLREEGWWLYPLMWFLTFFGVYLGPGALVFALLIAFWIYDGIKIMKLADNKAYLTNEKNKA